MPAEIRGAFRVLSGLAALVALAILLASCAGGLGSPPPKLVLLAPFEGQYREIGYNALYALQMAVADAGLKEVQFLAVDDGGGVESALARVKALNLDPAVAVIIALGPHATSHAAQQANNRPMILVGSWGQGRADPDSFYAASAILAEERQNGDLLMLAPARDSREGLSFFSSGSIADADFRERYRDSNPDAPLPNHLATLTYDLARMALAALEADIKIADAVYQGINGEIRFDDGFWKDAPLNRFRFEDGQFEPAAD